jgi:hypothetical protein
LPSKRAEFVGNKKRNEAAAAKVEMPLKMDFKYGCQLCIFVAEAGARDLCQSSKNYHSYTKQQILI